MPNYRRNYFGEYFFFTLVTQRRRKLFCNQSARDALHQVIKQTQSQLPWEMTGIVLLPEHLHMLWRMPQNDHDYSLRIGLIKRRFTKIYLSSGGQEAEILPGQARHRRRGVWQERFWEHTIRDGCDFKKHLEYIHINPVKHGLAEKPCQWKWSSFHEYVKKGDYENDWNGSIELAGNIEYFMPE